MFVRSKGTMCAFSAFWFQQLSVKWYIDLLYLIGYHIYRISTWELYSVIYTLSKSPIHLSLFDLLFSNYVVVYLSTYLCCSFLKLFNCHWVMDRVERSNSSLLLREKFRLLLPKVDRCMYADHENVLALKTAWEIDGDRTIANIRQLNEN